MAGDDPNHATRDLYQAIERKEYPSWTLEMQILTPDQARKFKWDIFGITKVWPHKEAPPIKIGKLVLNRNPLNYFADVEQAAFCSGNVVPGIAISPDKMLQSRVFSYHDTHIQRLGPNYYHLIPVNAPKNAPGNSYQRDGLMRSMPMEAPAPITGPTVSADRSQMQQQLSLPSNYPARRPTIPSVSQMTILCKQAISIAR